MNFIRRFNEKIIIFQIWLLISGMEVMKSKEKFQLIVSRLMPASLKTQGCEYHHNIKLISNSTFVF